MEKQTLCPPKRLRKLHCGHHVLIPLDAEGHEGREPDCQKCIEEDIKSRPVWNL